MSINQVLLPGDKLPRELKGTIKVGPGLFQVNNDLVSFKAGFFQKKENKVWLENNQKRYVPALNDPVVGFIIGKTSDYYRVDIGGAHPATLPILAFENATKRSHPSLEVNAIIYGKVTLANKDMEPELECLLPGFGPLNSSLPSFTTQISLFLARMLISDRHPLLSSIGELFPFEVAIGINGYIWLSADTAKKVTFIVNCLKRAEGNYFLNLETEGEEELFIENYKNWKNKFNIEILKLAKQFEIYQD